MPWKNMAYGIGLIGSTLEKPRLQCKPQIVFSFTIKTALGCAFAQRPVFYCCSNKGQQTITVGSGEGLCSLTVFPPTDFESVMSADSITPPYTLAFIHPTCWHQIASMRIIEGATF